MKRVLYPSLFGVRFPWGSGSFVGAASCRDLPRSGVNAVSRGKMPLPQKTKNRFAKGIEVRVGSRRRFLGWLGGIAAGTLAFPWLPRRGRALEPSLKEAAFYRRSNEDA